MKKVFINIWICSRVGQYNPWKKRSNKIFTALWLILLLFYYTCTNKSTCL